MVLTAGGTLDLPFLLCALVPGLVGLIAVKGACRQFQDGPVVGKPRRPLVQLREHPRWVLPGLITDQVPDVLRLGVSLVRRLNQQRHVREVRRLGPPLIAVLRKPTDNPRAGCQDAVDSGLGKLLGHLVRMGKPDRQAGCPREGMFPDFLGRAYEYLLRKFAEGSGQSAGEFFTPTEVGFLMAQIMRPRPGEDCHDYACGSAGLLVKLQLVARELDPTAKVPLKLTGQELQAESYAVAQMNGIIHDMEIEIARGDTMINPKFRTADGTVRTHDIVVANPMWNQPFAPDVFANDPFDRFRTAGGVTTGRGDWAWLQHTLACLNDHGRAAVVLDTGAVTRGSGSKNEDKERNIRQWFVDRDLIDGVILLPDNLFYNTTAAGVIVVLNMRKPAARKDKIVLLNASKRVKKGKPKNYIPEEAIRPLAAAFLKGDPIEGEMAVITRVQVAEADYNLSPSRWAAQADAGVIESVGSLLAQLTQLDSEAHQISISLAKLFAGGADARAR